jgi:hypothetical protein
MFLPLSRSLQCRLTHVSRIVRPPLALGPLAKLQATVESTAIAILNAPADLDRAVSMGLHHPLVCKLLRPLLGEGGFRVNATNVVPDSNGAEYERYPFAADSLVPCSGGTLPRRPPRGTPVSSPLLAASLHAHRPLSSARSLPLCGSLALPLP